MASFSSRRTKQAFRKDAASNVADEGLVGRRVVMDSIPSPSSYVRPASESARLGKRVRVPSGKQMLRFQYAPFRALDVDRILAHSSSVEVRVGAAHITSKNEGIKRRLVWGSGPYTDDSDVVAMLVHSGHVLIPGKGPAPYDSLLVTLSVERNNRNTSPPFRAHDGYGLRSRPWYGPYGGARVSVMRVTAVVDGHEKELPRPLITLVRRAIPRLRPWHSLVADTGRSVSGPTFSPEVACFDLTNRPCLAFSVSVVSDKGFDKMLWPSRRLWREVLYVETESKRYEIAKVDAPEREPVKDKDGKEKESGRDKEVGKERRKGLFVRFAQVSAKAIKRDIYCTDSTSITGPMDVVDLVPGFVVHKWSSFRWDPTGLTLSGVRYDLKRVSFRPIARKKDSEKADGK